MSKEKKKKKSKSPTRGIWDLKMNRAPTTSGSKGGGGGSPAPFLMKTYDIVDNLTIDEIVSWSQNKTCFVVWNPPKFAPVLLPAFFKHNNLQLHLPAQHLCLFSLSFSLRFLIICFDSTSNSNWVQLLIVEFI
jgi:hypothetical protein